MNALQKKVAVVTGASSGIGKAIALALCEQGVDLCLVGRDVSALQSIAETASQLGVRADCYQCDLGDERELDLLSAKLSRDLSAIDVIIHSAGIYIAGYLERALVADFDRQYRVNVRAPFALTQALLPMLRERRGQVVFINSTAGLNASAGVGHYAATKHALKALADSLRAEVNSDGVRVLSIYPGRTATLMQAAIFNSERRAYFPEKLLQPEDVATVVVSALMLPRTAEVTDVNIRPLTKSS
jgi:NADP-dependent 3-hydroxy acid dehydrogenase YdfG